MASPRIRQQAAAIPFRRRRGRTEVALVTSSDGKRWVLPKGGVERGESPGESALREALEEAGLRGRVRGRPVGRIRYRKPSGLCHVDFFLMQVTEELERWREDAVRRRRWLTLDEAQRRVDGRMRSVLENARTRIRV